MVLRAFRQPAFGFRDQPLQRGRQRLPLLTAQPHPGDGLSPQRVCCAPRGDEGAVAVAVVPEQVFDRAGCDVGAPGLVAAGCLEQRVEDGHGQRPLQGFVLHPLDRPPVLVHDLARDRPVRARPTPAGVVALDQPGGLIPAPPHARHRAAGPGGRGRVRRVAHGDDVGGSGEPVEHGPRRPGR